MTTSENTTDATASTDADTPDAPTGADDKTTNERTGRDERYRQRLRETEAQRDALLQRVEHMQRNEVQRLTADRLADPADLWRETELADLLDDDGNIDPAKLNTRVDTLLEEHPHWGAEPQRTPKPPRGFQSGASAPTQPRKDPWVSAFTPGGGSHGIRRD
jgi:hypothetical protein